MGGNGDSGRGRRVDEAAKRRFLAALGEGASVLGAAKAGGFCATSFYKERERDETFFRAWAEAIGAEFSPIVRPGYKRRLQRRKFRRQRFDEERRAAFLSQFARSCNIREAAAIAGVSESTVYLHRSQDAGFADAFQDALAQGYARLEVELLEERLEARRRLRALAFASEAAAGGEREVEFDRGMKMLARWDRGGVRVGPRTVSHGHRRRASFDEAIEALAKRLKSLDIPIKYLPAPEGSEAGEGAGE